MQAKESYPPSPNEPRLKLDAIAATDWNLVQQDQSAWSLELDVRPAVEKFFKSCFRPLTR